MRRPLPPPLLLPQQLPALLLLPLLPLLLLLDGADGYKDRTLELFGEVLHKDSTRNYDDIVESCFGGFGFKNCELAAKPKPRASLVLSAGGVHEPFHTDTYIKKGQKVCLECCAHVQSSRHFEETWSFKCPTTVAKGAHPDDELLETDVFAHEFRFARRRTPLDIQTIHCPLFREPEVQEIRATSPNFISGYFMLGLEWLFTRIVSFNATAVTSEEQKENFYDGVGRGQSLQSQIHQAFRGPNRKTRRDYGAVQVSRTGPDATNGYAWNVTFASGSNELWQENVRELQEVKEPERTDMYRKKRPWYQDEQYHVGTMFAMNNFTNTSIKLVGRKVEQKQLHGYHIVLEVNERGEGLDFWREVAGCQVFAIEAYGKPDHFHEHFTLRHSAAAGALRRGASVLSTLLAVASCWWLGLGLGG
jgi:hypothetical protein